MNFTLLIEVLLILLILSALAGWLMAWRLGYGEPALMFGSDCPNFHLFPAIVVSNQGCATPECRAEHLSVLLQFGPWYAGVIAQRDI